MDFYLWSKALHVISVLAWMAGLFYLPRLFVYHAKHAPGSECAEQLKVMEEKLLRIIMNPAMISSWVFGLLVAWFGDFWTDGWFHVKLLLVILMTVFHMFLASWRKQFARDENTRPEKFYRLVNEVPTILMIIIVFMVILKPF